MADRYHLQPISTLLMKHVVKEENDCWIWQGRLYPNGYGQFHVRRKVVYAHEASYREFVGPVPDGLELDHLCHGADPTCTAGNSCRHRRCINPAHLEPVTHAENVRRGASFKLHCPKGHPYDDQNAAHSSEGWKRCRVCDRERHRERHCRLHPEATQRGPYMSKYQRPEEIRRVVD